MYCEKQSESDLLRLKLKGLDAEKAIAVANEWAKAQVSVVSFVDVKSVNFEFPDKSKLSIPLPSDRFYVAVAPYLNTTHT